MNDSDADMILSKPYVIYRIIWTILKNIFTKLETTFSCLPTTTP